MRQPKTVWLNELAAKRAPRTRAVVALAALGTFAAPLQLAWAVPVSSTGRAAPTTTLPDDSARRTSERVRPARIDDPAGKVGTEALWRLFDGEASQGLEAWAPTRVRLTFSSPVAVDHVGAFGPAGGTLALIGADGRVTGATVDLTGRSSWTRLAVPAGPPVQSLTVEWTPTRPNAVLPELELWGRPSGAAPPGGDALVEALYRGVPSGADAYASREPERRVAASTPASDATFMLDLPRDPRSIDRAFLVYELGELPHFTAAKRSLNGGPAVGGFGVSYGAKGGLQVEEISPSALAKGANAIRFWPAEATDPTGYRVRDVRVVATRSAPGMAAADGDDLSDGDEATGWSNRQGAARRWRFSGVTQLREVEFRLARGDQGTLVLSAGAKANVTVDLGGLKPGWHKVALDGLPPVDVLTATLNGGREGQTLISELTISGSPVLGPGRAALVVVYPRHGECVNHQVHVRALAPSNTKVVRANGHAVSDLTLEPGALSFTVREKELGGGAGKPFTFPVETEQSDGRRARVDVAIQGCVDRPPVAHDRDGAAVQPKDDLGAPYGVVVSPASPAALQFAGATLEVPAGAVEANVRVTIRPLTTKALAPLDAGMTNVTAGGGGFRFGPRGMQFKKGVALALPVDRTRVAGDDRVQTFYYDEQAHKWQPITTIADEKAVAVSATTHFTDFIAATLAAPEHPGIQSLNPTSLKDIKLADPAAGVQLIAPPEPNSQGTAHLDYPIVVPPGRRGVQPALSISYDSMNANSWTGVGWDLAIPSIEIDTRFGVPRYIGTERFTLAGDELTKRSTVPSGAPAGTYFFRRAEGSYDWIQQVPTSGGGFSWLVTDKAGTKFTYGSSDSARLMPLTSGGAVERARTFRWMLEKVEDVFGNQVVYSYNVDRGNNGDPFVQVYPASIAYTSTPTSAAQYSVVFTTLTPARTDAFSTGRPGFQVLTRKLLDKVEVKNGTTVVRKYQLAYKTGEFGKQLIDTITVTGLGGAGPISQHKMGYFSTPPGTNGKPQVFGSPVDWSNVDNLNETNSTDTSEQHDWSLSSGGGLGIGLLGASMQEINGYSDRGLVDVNGDGLPDMTPASSVGTNFMTLAQQPDGTQRGPMSLDTFKDLHESYGSDKTHSMDSNYSVAGISGGRDYGTVTEGKSLFADLNGDGFPDYIWGDDKQLEASINTGDPLQGFKKGVIFPGYLGTGKSFDCNDVWTTANCPTAPPASAGPLFPTLDIITRWTAPRAGQVRITGALTRQEMGGDGMIASIFQNNTQKWKRTIAPNDGPCSGPSGTAACGGTPLTLTVAAGDEIYTRLNGIANTDHDLLKWDFTVDYTNTPAAEAATQEAWGALRYKWSEATDVRSVGQYYSPFKATYQGYVNVYLDLEKTSTSDAVDIDVTITGTFTWGIGSTLHYEASDALSIQDMYVGSVQVNPGDEIHVTVRHATPIDPSRLDVATRVVYTELCRTNPADQNYYCGWPVCNPVAEGGIATACTIENNTYPAVNGSTDPLAKSPVPGSAITTLIQPYFPLQKWLVDPPVTPNPPTTTIDGRKKNVAPSNNYYLELCAFDDGSEHLASGQPFTLMIQGVHSLLAKGNYDTTTVVNNGSVCLYSTQPMTSGQQMFFSLYTDATVGPISGLRLVANAYSSSWTLLNQTPYSVDSYHKSPAREIVKFPYFGQDDAMSSGWHDLSTGTWKGNVPFDRNLISPFDTTFAPFRTGPVPNPAGMPAGADTLSFSLGGLITTGLSLLAPNPADLVVDLVTGGPPGTTTLLRIHGTMIVNGVRGLGNLGGKLFAWAVCNVFGADYTVSGPRYTETQSCQTSWGAGLSVGTSIGQSVGGLDLIDINGDKYLDQVTTSGVRYLQYDPATNSGTYGPPTPIVLIPGKKFRSVHQQTYTGALGTGTPRADSQTATSAGRSAGVQIEASVDARVSRGFAKLDRDLRDVNGDGLPDLVDANGYALTVALNYGYGFGNPVSWTSVKWSKTQPNGPELFDGTVSSLLTNVRNVMTTKATDTSATIRLEEIGHKGSQAGIAYSGAGVTGGQDYTYVRTLVDLIDVNGDGLADQVLKEPGQPFKVKINLGTTFAAETAYDAIAWGNMPAMFPTSSPRFGIDIMDVDALGFSRTDAWVGSISIIAASGQWGVQNQHKVLSLMDVDGDGRVDHVIKNADVDNLGSTDNGKIRARLNQTGKSNLLQTVTRPLGGKIELDYARQGNKVGAFFRFDSSPVKVDMQDARMALSMIRVDDGRSNLITDTVTYKTFTVVNGVVSGFYDRLERKFLGFSQVTTTHADGSGERNYFHNQTVGLAGKPIATYTFDASGKILLGNVAAYSTQPVGGVFSGSPSSVQVVRIDARDLVYEGTLTTRTLDDRDPAHPLNYPTLAPSGAKWHATRRTFDGEGNLSTMTDFGDPDIAGDDISYALGYQGFSGQRFKAVSSIQALQGSTVIAKRAVTYALQQSASGVNAPAMTKLSDFVMGGKQPGGTAYPGTTSLDTSFTYSTATGNVGNLETTTDPTLYKLTFGYDALTHTHVTSVTDSFGYVSSSTINPDFGLVATKTDANGQIITFNYDAFGRTSKVWGPTDPTTGRPTIEMTYSQGSGTPSFPAWAMTKNAEYPATTGTVDTVAFADGMGRTIETKKEALVTASTGTTTSGFVVSGLMTFDERGRLKNQHQPFADAQAATTFLMQSAKNPISYTYDAADRITSILTSDGAITSTKYLVHAAGSAAADALPSSTIPLAVTATTDALNHISRTYRDSSSKTFAKRDLVTIGGAVKSLVTKYGYDAFGNATKVTDAKGNDTTAVYDSLSRLVSLTSKDTGLTEYRYNAAGLLGEKQTANLKSASQVIKYVYEVNRIKTVDYPLMTDITYTYGDSTKKGTANGNLVGRISQVTMENGSEQRFYDEFGNINKTVTTLKHVNAPTTANPTLTMKYQYDSWGRMQTMTFPKIVDGSWNVPTGDGEVITYAYDKGGLLKTITGKATPTSTAETYLSNIGYDEFGARSLYVAGNTISSAYTYTPQRHFLKTIDATAKPTTGNMKFQALNYAYDLLGNLKDTTTTANAQIASDTSAVGVGPIKAHYDYDEMNQLVGSTAQYRGHAAWGYRYSTSFGYDEIGNLTSKTQTDLRTSFTPTAADLTSQQDVRTLTGTTYTLGYTYQAARPHVVNTISDKNSAGTTQTRKENFDLNGNNTGDQLGTDAARTLVWDEENRLKQVKVGTSLLQQFQYDPDGQRRQRQESGGATTFYFNQFLVLHGNKTMTKSLFAGETRIASKTEGNGITPVRHFYHSDQLNSTAYVTDDKQVLVQHDRYFPYGEAWFEPSLEELNSAVRRDWKFTGKELDRETGFYYYGSRYMDPRTSNWLSADPILATYMGGNVNEGVFRPENLGLYTYTWNNPVRFSDPDGNAGREELKMEWDQIRADRAKNPQKASPPDRGEQVVQVIVVAGLGIVLVGAAVLMMPAATAAKVAPLLGPVAAIANSPQGQQAEQVLMAEAPAIAPALPAVAPQVANAASQIVNRNAYWGRIIGWGTGQTEGVRQTIQVKMEMTADTVKGWISQGLTKEWVTEQLNFYAKKLQDVGSAPNNQLRPRFELMTKILSLWPKDE